MHSFLKAEWKTILAVFLFCGAIFGWFYHDELEKERRENAPYVYECLRVGDGLLEYKLGTPRQALEPQLQAQNFTRTEDAPLHITRYERPDGAIALSFRDDTLAAIEFYPKKTENNPSCANDIVNLRSSIPMVASPIITDNTALIIYDGLVEIRQSEPISGDKAPEYHDYGWIVLAK